MRILHATTFLQGGAGRIIAALAVAQKRRGHDVRVVADAGGEPGYESYPEYLADLEAANVPLLGAQSTFKRDLVLNAAAAGAVRRWLGEWRPDVTHAHAAVPAIVARLSAATGSSPIVHTMHGWGTAKTAAQAAADLAILRLADAIVTPSHAARCALLDLGLGAPVPRVIPYGIERHRDDRCPDPADLALLDRRGPGRTRLLCIGTIGARKNQELVVEALAAEALRDATAVFIGDGDPEPLVRRARALGVERRIAVLGYRAHASRYLSAARVLVLPSRNEGLPLAVLEAFRAGTAVVASRIPELVEALADGQAGYLFEPEDAASLAAQLRRALDDDPRERADRLEAYFAARFDCARMVVAYEQLYERCAAGRGAAVAPVA